MAEEKEEGSREGGKMGRGEEWKEELWEGWKDTRNSPWGESFIIMYCDNLHWVPHIHHLDGELHNSFTGVLNHSKGPSRES